MPPEAVWFPLFGAVVGAAIALSGVLLNGRLTRKHETDRERRRIRREKLELAYGAARTLRNTMPVMMSCINKVHCVTDKIEVPQVFDDASRDLELGINLYIPELRPLAQRAIDERRCFGQLMFHAATTNFANVPLRIKQEWSGWFVFAHFHIDKTLENLVREIEKVAGDTL
jgi:hypothetical protein